MEYLDHVREYQFAAVIDPFDPDTLDVSEVEEFIVVSSPPLNEANYRKEGESTITAWLPWFSVVFYGPARVRVSARYSSHICRTVLRTGPWPPVALTISGAGGGPPNV